MPSPGHTNTKVIFVVIILIEMVQLCMMSGVQSKLDRWRWIGQELCWAVLLKMVSKDIVRAGLHGWAPRYGLMNRKMTVTASLLGLLLFSAFFFGITDLTLYLITNGKNLVGAISLTLALAFIIFWISGKNLVSAINLTAALAIIFRISVLLFVLITDDKNLVSGINLELALALFFDISSDLVFNWIINDKNLLSAIHLKLASGYRYLKRKSVTVVSLLGLLLLLALVFGGLHLTSDNRLAMTRGSEIKMVNNYYERSGDRMLLSINHETEGGNVGNDGGIINADLRLTAGNTDGSGQDQKALPHWTSNQNSNQSGKGYEEEREMQKQNGPGKPHLSAHKIIKTVVVPSIVVASALVVVCFVLLWCNCGNRAQQNRTLVQLELSRLTGYRRFQYVELAAATNNFANENKLGQGGFGPVYRGFLRDLDCHVAIKLLSADSSWQGQKEFEAEVKVLTQLRHKNIVQLVGWCDSNERFLLVYELMTEGSLDKHLHNPVRILSWQQRYKIILDLASALLYLHRCCDKCIVHGDIKPENVMLDASFNAKLGDFGTARLEEHGTDPRTTEIVAGTRGYIDPEFVNNHLRCPEADIYSFGVALLEIASGKRPASRQPDEASPLLVWVRHLHDRRMILDAADWKMNGEFDRQQMECVLVTGLWCAHQDPSQRPSIEQAMDVLRCVDATLPVLPATSDLQQVRFLEEQAYGDLTGEGASVDAVAASTCYLTSKDSAYLLAEE